MKTRAPRSKGKSVAMFLAISVLCGLLLSGLAVPFVALTSGLAKAASDSMQYLPTEFETPPQSQKSRILMADGSELANFFAPDPQRLHPGRVHPHPAVREAGADRDRSDPW